MPDGRVLLIVPSYFGMDTSIARAFRRNGIETLLIKSRYKSYLWEKVLRRLTLSFRWMNEYLQPLLQYPLLKENLEYITLAEKTDPSFVFIVKGETVFPETLNHLKNTLNVPCYSYQWDDPFYLTGEQKGADERRRTNFTKCMHYYDHIFVFDDHYVKEIKKKGISNVSYLPLATDEEVYKRKEVTEAERYKFGYDVCFVGAPVTNRLEVFNSLHDFHVGVFGENWERHHHKMNGNYFRGKASGEKVLKLYASSEIVLNIHHPQSIYGLNTRTFDIPSCGAFEIVDYKEGLEELFNIGEDIVCYRDIDELKDLVSYFLAHPEERRRIAERGCVRARTEHTWYQRVKKIKEIIK